MYILLTALWLHNLPTNLCNIIPDIIQLLNIFFPFFIKYLIGYCHFFYQLGYGLIFYIYIYRRYRAKKLNKWTTFYGNSCLNWILVNISIFVKYIFTKTLFNYLKNMFLLNSSINKLYITTYIFNNIYIIKLKKIIEYIFLTFNFKQWSPIFKKSSYISLLTSLKRFVNRK